MLEEEEKEETKKRNKGIVLPHEEHSDGVGSWTSGALGLMNRAHVRTVLKPSIAMELLL